MTFVTWDDIARLSQGTESVYTGFQSIEKTPRVINNKPNKGGAQSKKGTHIPPPPPIRAGFSVERPEKREKGRTIFEVKKKTTKQDEPKPEKKSALNPAAIVSRK